MTRILLAAIRVAQPTSSSGASSLSHSEYVTVSLQRCICQVLSCVHSTVKWRDKTVHINDASVRNQHKTHVTDWKLITVVKWFNWRCLVKPFNWMAVENQRYACSPVQRKCGKTQLCCSQYKHLSGSNWRASSIRMNKSGYLCSELLAFLVRDILWLWPGAVERHRRDPLACYCSFSIYTWCVSRNRRL